MKVVYLQILLMDNNEIMFNGRSLGCLKKEEEKYIFLSSLVGKIEKKGKTLIKEMKKLDDIIEEARRTK